MQLGQTAALLSPHRQGSLAVRQALHVQLATQTHLTTTRSGAESWHNSSTCAQELCSYVCSVSLSPSTCNEAVVFNRETYIYTYIWIQMGMGGDGV